LLKTHLFFSLLSTKPAESFSVLSSQRRQDWVSTFHSRIRERCFAIYERLVWYVFYVRVSAAADQWSRASF